MSYEGHAHRIQGLARRCSYKIRAVWWLSTCMWPEPQLQLQRMPAEPEAATGQCWGTSKEGCRPVIASAQHSVQHGACPASCRLGPAREQPGFLQLLWGPEASHIDSTAHCAALVLRSKLVRSSWQHTCDRYLR